MRLVVVIPPPPIVTAAEVRAQLRLDAGDDDAFLDGLIAVATAHIDGPDGWLGRAIGVQTLEAQLDGFYDGGRTEIMLPCRPVIEIVSVTYDDASGAAQVVLPAGYGLLGDIGLYPKPGITWPQAGAVRVRYRAGYPTVPASGDTPAKSTVPAPIRHAILMMVARLYASRGEDHATSLMHDKTAERLLAPYRVF